MSFVAQFARLTMVRLDAFDWLFILTLFNSLLCRLVHIPYVRLLFHHDNLGIAYVSFIRLVVMVLDVVTKLLIIPRIT